MAADLLAVVAESSCYGAAENSCYGFLTVCCWFHHRVEPLAFCGEGPIQLVNLCGGAWVSVRQEAVFDVVLAETVVNHVVGETVRHEVAGFDVFLGFQVRQRLAPDVRAEAAAGGDGDEAKALGNPLGLRSLARPRRPARSILVISGHSCCCVSYCVNFRTDEIWDDRSPFTTHSTLKASAGAVRPSPAPVEKSRCPGPAVKNNLLAAAGYVWRSLPDRLSRARAQPHRVEHPRTHPPMLSVRASQPCCGFEHRVRQFSINRDTCPDVSNWG